MIYKFGITIDIKNRTKENKHIFGDKFKIIDLHQVNNKEDIVKYFENDLKHKNLLTNLEINKHNYKDLFTINSEHSINDIIDSLNNIIENHKPGTHIFTEIEKHNQINDLNNYL
jgi:hypothetical protein